MKVTALLTAVNYPNHDNHNLIQCIILTWLGKKSGSSFWQSTWPLVPRTHLVTYGNRVFSAVAEAAANFGTLYL